MFENGNALLTKKKNREDFWKEQEEHERIVKSRHVQLKLFIERKEKV